MKIMNVVLCGLLMAGGASFGQSGQATPSAQSEAKQYKAVFVAKEVEGGKVINSREYDANLALNESPRGMGAIRTGERIPQSTGSGGQFQYYDSGVNLDYREARIQENSVLMTITASINSLAARPQDGTVQLPSIIRNNQWSGQVKVTLGKPEVIFSSDDVSSKRTMQLELTVTPVR